MRMKRSDYLALKIMISDFYNAERYESYLSCGHSNKRYLFDALYLSNMKTAVMYFICDHLYKYLNDEHIHTALKSIASSFHTLDNARATARG